MAPQICLSRHFSSQTTRGCISSTMDFISAAAEMGWENLDPLKWGMGITPETPTPFLIPTPKSTKPFHSFHPPGSPHPCLSSSSIGSLGSGHPRVGLTQGPPWGAALPSPRPGFSSSPQSSASSGAEAATAGNASGGRGLLRLGPPRQGGNQRGWAGGHKKALPLPGEFSEWGPSGRAGGPSLGTGTSGITAGMSRGGICCPLSPGESQPEATKSSQLCLPVSLSYHGVLFKGREEGGCHASSCMKFAVTWGGSTTGTS